MKDNALVFAAVVAIPPTLHSGDSDFGKKTTGTTWKGLDPDD